MSRTNLSRLNNLFAAIPFLIIVACGDDDALVIDDREIIVIKTGSFIDSAVSGIDYATETQLGTTNSFGEFKYVEGETITFRIGGIVLPSAPAQFILTPVELVGNGAQPTNTTVLNITRFLLSIDTDFDSSNGIDINEDVYDIAQNQLDFTVTPEVFGAEGSPATLFIESLGREDKEGAPISLVDKDTAEIHLKETINGIEESEFSNEFLSENTFSVVHDDGDVSELYFNAYENDDINTGSLTTPDGVIHEITKWAVTEDGELHFTVFDGLSPTNWEFVEPTVTASTAKYTYQRPLLANDVPAEGNMTLIENVITPNLLLGDFSEGKIFNLTQTNSSLSKLSFIELENEDGVLEPYSGTMFKGADSNEFTWSIKLGVLNITEIISGNDFSNWKFTATSISETSIGYDFAQNGELSGNTIISSGPGTMIQDVNVFTKNYLLGSLLKGNVLQVTPVDGTLSELSFIAVKDDLEEDKPNVGLLVRDGVSSEFTWSLELGILTITEITDADNSEFIKWIFTVTSVTGDENIAYTVDRSIKLADSTTTESDTGTMNIKASE